MVVHTLEEGFTVAEMVVTIVVMSVFVGLLFQVYIASQSQQVAVTERASANDIATTNLKKIVSRSSTLLSSISCDSTNDLTAGADPQTGGTAITLNPAGSGVAPEAEDLTNTKLPSSTTQSLKVFFPRGCDSNAPIEIMSTVNYGTGSVTNATYVD